MKIVGELIAETDDLYPFKRADQMLFEQVETAQEQSGDWKLSKVIPREEFRKFF